MANFLRAKNKPWFGIEIPGARVFAFSLLVFSLFMITGILAYKAAGGDTEPTNFLQTIVAGVFKFLGLTGSLFGLILVLIWSARWFLSGKMTKPGIKAFGILGLVISSSGLSGIVARASGTEGGGILGTLMAERVGAVLGTTFCLIVFSVLLVSSMLIATNWLFVDEFKEIMEKKQKDRTSVPDMSLEEEEALTGRVDRERDEETKLEVQDGRQTEEPVKEEEQEKKEERIIQPYPLLFKPVPESKPGTVPGKPVEEEKKHGQEVPQETEPEPGLEPRVEIPRPEVPEEKEKEREVPEVDPELLDAAARLVIKAGRASITLIQRNLKTTFNEASRLLDNLEARGVVGPYKGSLAREILLSLDEWEKSKIKEKS